MNAIKEETIIVKQMLKKKLQEATCLPLTLSTKEINDLEFRYQIQVRIGNAAVTVERNLKQIIGRAQEALTYLEKGNVNSVFDVREIDSSSLINSANEAAMASLGELKSLLFVDSELQKSQALL